MGTCLSTTKVSGSSSTTSSSHHHRKDKQSSAATTSNNAGTESQNPTNLQLRNSQQHLNNKHKPSTRKQSGIIPWGKRTDFGYHKDFDKRYMIGKLLGHGQFGYTYIATDIANGDRVAVKKIEKTKHDYGNLSVF